MCLLRLDRAVVNRLHERYRHLEFLCFDIACVVGIVMAFYSFDRTSLWVDEAETAFVAKGIVATGYPLAFDGEQIYPGKSSYYNDSYLWMELPWIQFYVTALSFLFFNPDGWSARLPFIVIGILALPLVFQVTRILFDQAVARVTLLLLLYSTPYLMHIRQCRYFSLLAVGTILGIWAYLKLKEEKKWAWPVFAAAAIFLFHSHYAYFFAYMGGWGFWILLFDRPARWKPLLMATGCILLCTFPWALYVNLFTRRSSYGGWSFWLFIDNLGYYARVLHQYVIPFLSFPILLLILDRSTGRRPARWLDLLLPALLIIFLLIPDRPERLQAIKVITGGMLFVLSCVWAVTRWKLANLKHQHNGRFLLLYISGMLLALSIILPNHAFRYLVGFIPLFYMLLACLLTQLWKSSRLWCLTAAVLLTATNFLSTMPMTLLAWSSVKAQQMESAVASLPSEWTLRLTGGYTPEEMRTRLSPALARVDKTLADEAMVHFPLFDYFNEMTHPYNGPVEVTIAYLKEYARPEDTFSSDCDGVALAFYTNLKFQGIKTDMNNPNATWISLRPHHFYATNPAEKIRHFYDQVLMTSYDKIELDAPDLDNINYNLPDPDTHLFYPDQVQAQAPKMILLHRKSALSENRWDR